MSLESEPQEDAGFENRPGEDIDDDVLQESDMTPLTDGSTSEESGGWLGGIGTDFRNIANSLKHAVPPTIGAIGDIADFVQRSAHSLAAEIAQFEDFSDEEGLDLDQILRLPWEILTETDSGHVEYQEDETLKASIMALSSNRATFLKPFSVRGTSKLSPEGNDDFIDLDEPRIHQIRRLLVIDDNLAATHSVLSGRSDVKETIFWTNYFYNCEKVRREHLENMQSSSIISTLSSPEETLTDPPPPEAAAMPESDLEANISTQAESSRDEGKVSRSSSQNSLVPADDSSSQASEADAKDDSFVQVNSRSGIASPPCSLVSVEDLIVVSMHTSADN